MIRRLIAGVVVAVGLLSVAIGVQRWFDARAAEGVVHSLMAAVESGNRAASLRLLTPDRRKIVDLSSAMADGGNVWQKQPGMSYHIRGMQIDGDRAVASVTIERDGYILQPTVYLQRGAASRWKIDRVEDMQVDPQYLKDRRAYQRQQGEQLAEELREALDGRPGISIERVTISETPGADRR